MDAVSVREFIDASGGDPEFRMLNEVFWGTNCQAPCADVGAAWAFAWYAFSGFDALRMAENIYTFKLEGGMERLTHAILSDGSPEIRLGTRVTAIAQTTSGVTSTLHDGEDLESRAVVVATPLNTWSSIDFEPELSDPKRELTARGHAGRGVKVIF